jgi:hypothetical protein
VKFPKKYFYAINATLGMAGLLMIYNNMSYAPTDCYSRFAEAQNQAVSRYHACQQNAGSPEQTLACFEAYSAQRPALEPSCQ